MTSKRTSFLPCDYSKPKSIICDRGMVHTGPNADKNQKYKGWTFCELSPTPFNYLLQNFRTFLF